MSKDYLSIKTEEHPVLNFSRAGMNSELRFKYRTLLR